LLKMSLSSVTNWRNCDMVLPVLYSKCG
jgi:hypothetical protein